MKKFTTILLIAICLVFAACSGGGTEEHICSFDNPKLQCSCGEIKEGIIAFIGSSFEDCEARFVTLQDAVNFCDPTKGKATVIHLYGEKVSDRGFELKHSAPIVLDFGTTEVTFTTENPITVSSGSLTLEGEKEVKSCDGKALNIVVNGGSLEAKAPACLALSLSENSTVRLESAKISIEKCTVESGAEDVEISVIAGVKVFEDVVDVVKEHVPAEQQDVIEEYHEHSFGPVSYKWNKSECTATKKCTHEDCDECISETVDTIFTQGCGYVATFKNKEFTSQTRGTGEEQFCGQVVSLSVTRLKESFTDTLRPMTGLLGELAFNTIINTYGKDLQWLKRLKDEQTYWDYHFDKVCKIINNSSKSDVYQVIVNYVTENLLGQKTVASAVMYVPRSSKSLPIYSIHRTSRVERNDCASVNALDFPTKIDDFFNMNFDSYSLFEDDLYPYYVAKNGYIALIADGLGFGVSTDTPAYGIVETGRAYADAVYAAEKIKLSEQNASYWNGKTVYLAGFSEGGFSSMATAGVLAKEGHDATALCAVSGCHSISDSTFTGLSAKDITFGGAYFVPMMINSLSECSGTSFTDYMALSMDGDSLEALLDGNHSSGSINSYIYGKLGTSAKVSDMLADPDALKSELATHDSFYGFKNTKTKIKLYHIAKDDYFDSSNMDKAEEGLSVNGSDMSLFSKEIFNETLVHADMGGHVLGCVAAILHSFDYLDGLR